MTIDKAILEVLANYCAAAAESMAYTLMRTAHSTFVKETEDFTCQLLTPEGLTFASPKGIGATWFTGLDYGQVIPMIDRYEEGDVAMTSDPYSGFLATHAPDAHLWKPIFHRGELVCFVGCHVHNTDVGGAVPASLSRSLVEVHQEGIRVPPLKIVRKGEFNEDVLKILRINVRQPEQNWGDLNAQIACVNTGERKILEIIERFGIDTFRSAMVELLDYAEQQARALVRKMPDGDYFFADYVDEDAPGGHPCRVALTLKVHGDTLTMDFTGSDPQLRSSLNMPTGGHPRHALVTVSLILVLSTLDPNIVLNYGTARIATTILPEGTVMNATPPAAVGMRSLICYLTQTVVLGAFSRVLPTRLGACPACGPSMMNVKTADRTGRPFMASIGPIGGGGGGSAFEDGAEGAGATHSFLRNTPVEINESEVPVRIIKYGLAPDSGGPGLHRGGLAAMMEFQLFAPNSMVTARNRDRSNFNCWGIRGGQAGANSRFIRNPGTDHAVELANTDVVNCEPSDIIRIIGSGAGGYGNAFERPIDLVLRDVRCGFVSRENAQKQYGVVIGADMAVDEVATKRLRDAAPIPDPLRHFDYGDFRRAFEAIWTEPRYVALTAILAQIPVTWRYFVKDRMFRALQTQPAAGSDGVGDVHALYAAIAAEFADLPAVRRDGAPAPAAAPAERAATAG